MDTNDIPVARRLETCRRVICDTYVGFDCVFADENFRLVIDGHDLDGVSVTRITSSHHYVDRSPTLIKRDQLAYIYFGLVLAGQVSIIQGGREAVIGPGMFALNDSTRPFRTYLGEASDVCWLGIPKVQLDGHLTVVEDATAVGFVAVEPLRRIACRFLEDLGETCGSQTPPGSAGKLVSIAADLLIMTIARDAPRARSHVN